MKTTYDKKVSRYHIKEGDSVMLWWPYFKKGLSRSLQPKWKGPFLVKKVIGETNCTLTLDDGTEKHVHLNQLKPVERRRILNSHTQSTPQAPAKGVSVDSPVVELHDLPEDETDYESASESLEDASTGDERNNDRWCGVSGSNIIGTRTRSGLNGGGG